MLKIIRGIPRNAQENMDLDRELLEDLSENGSPILHFYDWKRPSITYGYFIKIHNLMDLEKLKKRSIDIGRRPTGGGVVFHMWDMAFSFLMPSKSKYFYLNPLENYRFINNIVFQTILEFLEKEVKKISLMDEEGIKDNIAHDFCMGHATKYDIIIKGKKVVGAAQRRKKNGFLHQGTISLFKPEKEVLQDILLKDVLEIISSTSYPLLGSYDQNREIFLRNKLQDLLIKNFQKILF